MNSGWPTWVCPAHAKPLERRNGALHCALGHDYEVRDDVPRFVADSGYAAAFGHQWNRFRLTQLDSRTGLPITRDRLERILGPEIWSGLAGAEVLEAGCGAGRFTEVLLDRGARLVSIDLSAAVDANARTFPPDPRHAIAQASVYDLPLTAGGFDLVVAVGMLQHTPSPERSTEALYSLVRPGGWLAIDHYPWSLGRLRLAPLFRARYKRLPPEVAMRRVERLVDRLLPLHRRAAASRIAHLALTRLSPVQDYYRSIPELGDSEQRDWAVLDTYDALTDAHKHLRTRGAIERMLTDLGAEQISCWKAGNGIEARARKPR